MSRPGKKQRERAKKQRKAQRRHGSVNARPVPHARLATAEPVLGVEPVRIDPALRWHIARLLSRLGDRALKALEKAEVARFQPRVDRIVVIRGRRVVHSAQLLPRTVFIGIRDDLHLAEARGVPGLAEIVSHPEPEDERASKGNIAGVVMKPTRLDPEALQRFADAVAKGEIVAPIGVSVGMSVVVEAGPFASFPGVVEAILPGDRLKVGVSIFGRNTPVELGLVEVRLV